MAVAIALCRASAGIRVPSWCQIVGTILRRGRECMNAYLFVLLFCFVMIVLVERFCWPVVTVQCPTPLLPFTIDAQKPDGHHSRAHPACCLDVLKDGFVFDYENNPPTSPAYCWDALSGGHVYSCFCFVCCKEISSSLSVGLWRRPASCLCSSCIFSALFSTM